MTTRLGPSGQFTVTNASIDAIPASALSAIPEIAHPCNWPGALGDGAGSKNVSDASL